MISIDFECSNRHRFEGCFKDHDAFQKQLDSKMISCPVCNSNCIKRLFTGCSIQARQSVLLKGSQATGLFELIRAFNAYVKDTYENVGRDFVSVARAIHYGQEDERGIYGETTIDEARELQEEGIGILPMIDIDKIEN